jgi:hypothetical protein
MPARRSSESRVVACSGLRAKCSRGPDHPVARSDVDAQAFTGNRRLAFSLDRVARWQWS